MTPQPNSNDGCITLPRGGYLVDTSVGYIQFGSPPETIKDTMKMEKSTPLIFVVPNKFFHIDKGISTAELEFPLYFNFFLRQKRTKIVCTEKQVEQLKVVLEESVFRTMVMEIIDFRRSHMKQTAIEAYFHFTKVANTPDSNPIIIL